MKNERKKYADRKLKKERKKERKIKIKEERKKVRERERKKNARKKERVSPQEVCYWLGQKKQMEGVINCSLPSILWH